MHELLQSVPLTLQQATINPHLCWRLLDTHGAVSCHYSFLLGPGAHKVLCALQESVSPVLCKFWQLYGGDNGDLLQEGLFYTQVCCTQSPCPCSNPLLTRTSTGDTQTQFCLSFCGVSGSWCTQGMFEPSEHLWQVWGLIPGWGRAPGEGNGNPLQYSCLGNPVERGTWWATAHGVLKNRTCLSN